MFLFLNTLILLVYEDLQTPSFVIDLDKTMRNIREMQELANKYGKKLRPHVKTHKIPYLAHLQVSQGAVGICTQKVSEAEVFAKAGINNILISNEVLGRDKIRKVFELINLGKKIMVAVDSTLGIQELEEIGKGYSLSIDILVDVNVGMNRCGISPKESDEIIEELRKTTHVNFVGFMGYDGHTANIRDINERKIAVDKGLEILMEVNKKFKAKGFTADIISVGGTPSAALWAEKEEITELQPGTYVFYDIHQVELGVTDINHISAFVVSQVISRSEDKVVTDVGYKGIGIELGMYPTVVSHQGLKVKSMSEEHTVLTGDRLPQLEERVVMIPYHICPTVDMWDEAIVIKNGKEIGKLRIEARGKKY